MLTEWLQRRCPSAVPVGVAYVADWTLNFSKRSRYGSGKATIEPTPGQQVLGVLFDIEQVEQQKLDRAEGPGYDRVDNFSVQIADADETVSAVAYIAKSTSTDETLKPCDWYLGLVIAGAQQHGLPCAYVNEIRATASMTDPIPERSGGLEARAMLKRCGF